MLSGKVLWSTLLAGALLVTLSAQENPQRDTQPPHDASAGIDCSTCHVPFGSAPNPVPSLWITTSVCWSCHTETGPGGWADAHYTGGDTLGCTACHNPHVHQEEYPARYIRSNVETPHSGSRALAFRSGDDFLHGSGGVFQPYDGICETCHTQTSHHRNSAEGDHDHYFQVTCTSCHTHANGFLPDMTSGSHFTHLSADRGPHLDCGGCHAAEIPLFADGRELASTTVCNSCHSPDGAFDGVNDPLAGARFNWDDGVYDGGELRPGKEYWCAGCHDLGTSVINGVGAPPVAGDQSTWGFFFSGHGRSGQVSCIQCHDPGGVHVDGEPRSYAAVLDNYQAAYRLRSVNNGPPLVIPRLGLNWNDPYDDSPYWELCFACHDRYALFGGPDAPPGPYYSPQFQTNFRSDSIVIVPDGFDTDIGPQSVNGAHWANSHQQHLKAPPIFYDSDYDGTADSYNSCTSCHNVHGSTSYAMIRDGRLIGAEPCLNFSYVAWDHDVPSGGGCPDHLVFMTSEGVDGPSSLGGIMRTNSVAPQNGVCNGCHGGGANTDDPMYVVNCYGPDNLDYYRVWIVPPEPASGW